MRQVIWIAKITKNLLNFLNSFILEDKLIENYLTGKNLVLLFWYELTGYTSNPNNEEITKDMIFHVTNCDNELIRYCIKELRNLGCDTEANDLDKNYMILKLTFAPELSEQIQLESDRIQKKKRLWKPLKLALLLIFMTVISTQYLVSSSLGINLFSIVVESIQEKLGLRVPENYPRENKDLLSFTFKWMPKGYKLSKMSSESTTYGEIYYFKYICPKKEPITLSVEKYLDTSFDVDVKQMVV